MQFYFDLEQVGPLDKDLVFAPEHCDLYLEPTGVAMMMAEPEGAGAF